MTTSINSPPAFLYAPDFFKTNCVFTDIDQKLIQQHLRYAEASLLDIQKSRQDVVDEQRGVQDLSCQERKLVDLVERCRFALSPAKKLPDDVLQCIFIICCEGPTQFLSPDSNRSLLITLCSVCSAWRNVALGTPIIWSQINVCYYGWRSSYAHHISQVEEAIKFWFGCARTYPISLEVDIRFDDSTAYSQELEDLVARVIALPSRYRKLDLKFSTNDMGIVLGKLSPDQLLHMEKLNVDHRSFNRVGIQSMMNLPFSPATTFPNLKELKATCYWNPYNLRGLLPFPSLQMLDIKTTMPLVLELFQQSPLLKECGITIGPSDSNVRSRLTNGTHYITLPLLQTVTMTFDNTEDCCIFIDQLVLSDLQCLEIFASRKTTFDSHVLAERVVALSRRSGTPNIREFYFNARLVPLLNIGVLLRSLPHLERIDIGGTAILDEETLDGLAMGRFGPCLGSLHAEYIEADDNALTRMVRQRGQNAALTKLDVWTNRAILSEFGWDKLTYGS